MERRLLSADERFKKLIEDLRIAMGEIGRMSKEYDERNVEFESQIQHIKSQNQQKDIEKKTSMERLSKMEHFLAEQDKRFVNTQKELGGKLRRGMEGLSSQSASSGLRRGPKKRTVSKTTISTD